MDKRDLHEKYLIILTIICCVIIIAFNTFGSAEMGKVIFTSEKAETVSTPQERIESNIAQIRDLSDKAFESSENDENEVSQDENISDESESSLNSAPGKVNINTASAEEISNILPGIGTVKAQAIVDYRNIYGPYQNIDELLNVKGIGEKTLENIRPYCIV